jgi:hypothetical protein
MMYFGTIGGGWGGLLLQYWQVSAPLGQQLKFWFLGFVFEQAGMDLEKKEIK